MKTLSYYQKIVFEGKDFILVDGAITTKERFENGTVSFGHLYVDGTIKRFNKVIGTKDDITFTNQYIEASSSFDFNRFLDGIFGESWFS